MSPEINELYEAALDFARSGQFDDAHSALTEVLEREPRLAEAWSLQGAVQLQQARPGEALTAYDRATSLGADDARTHLGRGLALVEFERNDEALLSFERAIARDPRLLRAHAGRSRTLRGIGRTAEALESADQALALDSGHADAWRQRGLALFDLERFEDALEAFRSMSPAGSPIQRSDVMTDVGLAHEGLGQYEQALAAYDEAVRVAPGSWLAPYRRAFVRLLHGDFGGWSDYESRWRRRHIPTNAIGQMTPALRERLTVAPTIEDLRGQRVLVVGEQGIGDIVMFASVLPDLAAVAAHVTCLVEHRLLALFSVSFPEVDVVAGQGPALVDLSRIDRILAIGSLPHAFRRTVESFPGRPYLRPRATVAEAWRARLGPADGRLRIGVSWRGGTTRTRTGSRSMSLEALRPLLERPELDVVSLQYGGVAGEVADINRSLARPVRFFPDAEIGDFEQLAGLVSALDVVVTVQTAVAHLAGALGQRGLVMIPRYAEWRYGLTGSSMPWYRSLHLLRQGASGAWADVIAQATATLTLPSGPGLPSTPRVT